MLAEGSLLQGRYEVRGQLGQGGMGVVYLATDRRLADLAVAVKQIDASQVAPKDRQWTIEAFRQEAQLLARLNHPGIARVMDYFSEGDYSYLIMDYVPGETLEAALAQAPHGFDERQALVWAGQLAMILDHLHAQNPPIVFRDLKPGNVMVQPDGALRLIDFGIARLFKPGQTQDTVFMGTPGYAAPEQYGRGQSDARSDVYTLGVVVHQLLTGYDPMKTPMRLPPVRQLRPDLSAQTEAAVAQALQLNPDRRYASTIAFARALGAPVSQPLPGVPVGYVTDPMPSAVPERGPAEDRAGLPGWVKAALAVLLLALLLLAGWWLFRDRLGGGATAGAGNEAPTALVTQIVTPTPQEGAVVAGATVADTGVVESTPPPDKTPTPGADDGAALAARETELAATVAAINLRETEVALAVTQTAVSAGVQQATTATAATATAAVATEAAEQMAMIMTRAIWDAQTATAEARPVACAAAPRSAFASLWNQDQLGCALNGGNGNLWMAMQTFDGGVMFWREDTDRVHVLYNSGGWERHSDNWQEGDAEFSCGTQESPPTPKRGFGKVWCSFDSVRNGLGNARDAEWGAAGAAQDFENGMIVLAPNGRTYVLYTDNGTWR